MAPQPEPKSLTLKKLRQAIANARTAFAHNSPASNDDKVASLAAINDLWQEFSPGSALLPSSAHGMDFGHAGKQALVGIFEALLCGPPEAMKKPITVNDMNDIQNTFITFFETQIDKAALDMGVEEEKEEG